MKRLLIVAIVIALVGIGWYALRGTTTEVAADDARELVDADAPDDTVDAGDRPAAGTWTYRGSGSDSFDALGGDAHEFPDEISVVVELDREDSCAWAMHVVFVEEHIEQRNLCTRDGAISEATFDRTTTFIGRTQTSSYECNDDSVRLPSGASKGDTWTFECTEERGAVVTYTAQHMGEQPMTIDGKQVPTTHVRIVGRQRNENRGDERTEYWLIESGLPARFTTDRTIAVKTPLGIMRTAETWDYTLTSLEPVAE